MGGGVCRVGAEVAEIRIGALMSAVVCGQGRLLAPLWCVDVVVFGGKPLHRELKATHFNQNATSDFHFRPFLGFCGVAHTC